MDTRRPVLTAVCLMLAARTAGADDTKSPGWALGLPIGATMGGLLLVGSKRYNREHPITVAPVLTANGAGAMVTGSF